jgi:hypothetical protein
MVVHGCVSVILALREVNRRDISYGQSQAKYLSLYLKK